MPSAAPKACRCGGIVGQCSCRKIARQQHDAQRGTSKERGYGFRDWRPLRDRYIKAHPLCADPFKVHGLTYVLATDVDHIIPHRGDDSLRLDWNNLRSLCHQCHSRKTATEDGGFRGRGGSNLHDFTR